MKKIKKAQLGRQDFTDVNVRRLTGNMNEKAFQMREKLQKIEQINSQMDDLKMQNPHIGLTELPQLYPDLWAMFEDVMEGDWSLNPFE